MDKGNQIAIILLNWNTAAVTLRSVEEISGWSKLNTEIVVVDNGSSPGDLSLLNNGGDTYTLLSNTCNRGYAGGNNTGISYALEKKFNFILLLNSDARVSESCLEMLVEFMRKQPLIGVTGPLVKEGERWYAGGRNIGWYSDTKIRYNPERTINDFIETDYVPGTVFLARREVFERAGLLDEEFFFSGEIADFCRRLQGYGFRCGIHCGCYAVHNPDPDSKIRESLYNYYNYRNRFLFIRNHYPHVRTVLQMRWIAGGVFQAGLARISGRRERACAIWSGTVDGMRGRFGDMNVRFIDQGKCSHS